MVEPDDEQERHYMDDVRARAMFGGYGIYHEGVMFALTAWEKLYFKVDAQTKVAFAEAGSQPFVYDGKGKPMEMSYWEAPAGSMDDPGALEPWARLGVEAAARSDKTKKSKRKQG